MMSLQDNSPKRQKHSLAELSRPNRTEKELACQKKTHQSGRKRKNLHRDAIYHNWHGPFTWNQIVDAARHPSVGSKMSSTKIIQILKKKDAVTFKNLSRSTVESWIERPKEGKPQWSDAALRMAENGNHQGHGNGGRHGVFVSEELLQLS